MAEAPSVCNDVQRGENARKKSFLNYKSAALNQLSYAGVPHAKAVFSGLIKRSSRPHFRAPRCKRDQNFTVLFYGTRNGLEPPGVGVVSFITSSDRQPERIHFPARSEREAHSFVV